MLKTRAGWMVVAWLLGAGLAAVAQELEHEIPEVVVTATRTQTRVDEVTSSVTVLDESDIARRGQESAIDALRSVPGVDVTEFGTPGRSAFATIRGSNPDQVLVQLDGVEVNTPTVGQFDFANLTTDGIDRIEVLRGGGGALYGSEAIGGVVNVITRRGAGPFHLDLSSEAGSAATHHEIIGLNGARGPLALSGTASFFASDGFRSINDDYRNFSTVWRADADVLPSATARGFVRYTNARAGLANFNVAENRLDADARSRSDFFLAKTEWEQVISEAVNYRVATSIVRDDLRYRDDQVDPEGSGEIEPVVIAHFPSEILAAETQWNFLWREWSQSTVGLDFKERSARLFRQQPATDEADDAGTEVERFNPNGSSVGAYVQEQLHAADDALRAVGGVRYDAYDHFGDEVTWSGSGSYLVRPSQTRLRLGYAEGFRTPTFDEQFEALGQGLNLQAERSWELDAGLTQELFDGSVRLEPTYFYRRVANLIEEVADELPAPVAHIPEGQAVQNVDAHFHGLELAAQARPLRWLMLSGTYMYLHYDTNTLLNRPQHRGAALASVDRGDVLMSGDHATLALRVNAVGRRDSADPFNKFLPATIGSYVRADLSLAYQFAGRWAPLSARATVRNLFNRDYSESIGFPAPPAHFLMGLHYQL
jgi:vitamin B12 transporter